MDAPVPTPASSNDMAPLFRTISRTDRAICTIAAILFAGMATCASAGMEAPRDTAAVRAVKLDMDLVNRLGAVAREALPRLDDRDSVLYLRDGEGRPKTVAQLVDDINETPVLAAAVAAQGFTPREYALAVLAVINAYTAAAASNGAEASNDAAASADPQQVRFVRMHLDAIRGAMSP